MNILIIGATRGIGAKVIDQALLQNHNVTVLARQPSDIVQRDERLRLVAGDIRDAEAVAGAVEDQAAVIITIGQGTSRKPVTLFSEGTGTVISAMKRHGVGRLICVTGIGAGDSKGHGGFLYDKIVNPLLLKTNYEDKDRQEALIRESGLDWVIVRPGFLTDGGFTKRYRALTDLAGVQAGKISRADVAHFILKQLESKAYLGQTPLLTY